MHSITSSRGKQASVSTRDWHQRKPPSTTVVSTHPSGHARSTQCSHPLGSRPPFEDVIKVKWGHIRGGQDPICPFNRAGTLDRATHRKNTAWSRAETGAMRLWPRNRTASGRQKLEEAGGSTGSESPAVPTPRFWTSGLQKKCGLSHKSEGLWYSC